MTKALAAAPVLWLAFLATGTFTEIRGSGAKFAVVVYAAGRAVCHQRPERSFHTHDAQWPVCARCAGLYLTAPLGALAAAASRRQLQRRRDLRLLSIAALPTAVTFLLEHAGLAPVTSMARFITALPLGAALAWVIVSAASGEGQPADIN